MIYPDLRTANIARQIEWASNGAKLSLAFKANELFGEAGEAANVIKKLARERLGLPGSRDTVEHLAEELADVVICVDLLALELGLPMMEIPTLDNVSLFDLAAGGARLATTVGRVCALVDHEATHTDLFEIALQDVVYAAQLLAHAEKINLQAAIASKFNATSKKVGLETHLAA